MALEDCVPKDKYDTAAVDRAAALGYPTINSVLPELLRWLKDGNWPVAKGVGCLLTKAGPEIAPHIVAVLNSQDAAWKYWILLYVVKELRSDVWKMIEQDVKRLSISPTADDRFEEIDVIARELLAERSSAYE